MTFKSCHRQTVLGHRNKHFAVTVRPPMDAHWTVSERPLFEALTRHLAHDDGIIGMISGMVGTVTSDRGNFG